MTREERLQQAKELLEAAYEVLGEQWPLLSMQVSNVQSSVSHAIKVMGEAAA
jgi:hypothetical protein